MEISTINVMIMVNILYLLVSVQGYLRIFKDSEAEKYYFQECNAGRIEVNFGRHSAAIAYGEAEYVEICTKHFMFMEVIGSQRISVAQAKQADIRCYTAMHAPAGPNDYVQLGDVKLPAPDMIFCYCVSKFREIRLGSQHFFLVRHQQGFYELQLFDLANNYTVNPAIQRRFQVYAYWKVDPYTNLINEIKLRFPDFNEDKVNYKKLDSLLKISNMNLSTLNPNKLMYENEETIESAFVTPAIHDN